ncbi:MAG: SUMF1/EgtB/PvdO family nonheme iron enzyme, partial [Rhodospirillales bacterium]
MLLLSKLHTNTPLSVFFSFLIYSSVLGETPPEGMALVTGGDYEYKQINRWREGLENHKYLEGPVGDAYVEEAFLQMPSYFIDKTEVTNAQYNEFMDTTGYKPKWPKNFLKHWTKGTYPNGEANHPVTYIDLSDAKAYAEWAGKE